MAPEQFEGEADVRSDVYSFGVVMYQMINNGGLPFSPRPGHTWEDAHNSYPVPPLDGGLFPLVAICLEKSPAKRYKGFDELRQGLESVYYEEITKQTGEKPPPHPGTVELEAWELVNKGVSLANLGLHDEAIDAYRQALRINPEDANAYNNLGIALKDKGLLDEAIDAFEAFIRYALPEYAGHVERVKEVIKDLKGS